MVRGDRRAFVSLLLGAVAALALAARASRAGPSPGEVKGTLAMSEKVKQRAGTVLILLEPTDGATVAQAPANHVIKQRDARFLPAFLAVAKGDTVDFVNDEVEDLQHNVYSFSDAKKFDLGLFGKKSDRSSVTFDQAGEVDIYCSIHKFMSGTILVAPTPCFAMVDLDSGAFDVPNVPPGAWKATTWSSSKRYVDEEATFTVKPGEATELSLTFGRRK